MEASIVVRKILIIHGSGTEIRFDCFKFYFVSQSLLNKVIVACIVVSNLDPDRILCRLCCIEWRLRLRWWRNSQWKKGDDDQRWLWDTWELFCLLGCLVGVVFVGNQQQSTYNRDLDGRNLERRKWNWKKILGIKLKFWFYWIKLRKIIWKKKNSRKKILT